MSHHPPRALVFDLDGTLVDSAPDLHAVLAVLLGERGLPTPDLAAVRDMIGDGAPVLVRRAFAAAGANLEEPDLQAAAARYIDLYAAQPCRLTTLYADVADTLRRLRDDGFRLGLCTNKPQRPTELVLTALGLDRLFGSVVGGDAVERRKPDGEHVHVVMRQLGVSRERAVFVGDSRNDLLAAHAAGLPCVLVSYGYTTVPAHELGAERVIERFADLPAAVASLDSGWSRP